MTGLDTNNCETSSVRKSINRTNSAEASADHENLSNFHIPSLALQFLVINRSLGKFLNYSQIIELVFKSISYILRAGDSVKI